MSGHASLNTSKAISFEARGLLKVEEVICHVDQIIDVRTNVTTELISFPLLFLPTFTLSLQDPNPGPEV